MGEGTMSLGLGPSTGDVTLPLWGIDPQTTRVSVGIRMGAGATAHTLELPPRKGFKNDESKEAWWHAVVVRDLLRFFRALKEEHGVPAAVRLEEPFGGVIQGKGGAKGKVRAPAQSSGRAFGATLAGLGLALGPGVPVEFCSPPEWKARALGKGHGFAEKPTIVAWAEGTFGWVSADRPDDEADALGIAESFAVDRAAPDYGWKVAGS